MHWRFDPLFSIAVYHSKYKNPDPDTGESPPKAPDFILEPSKDTLFRLTRLGWLVKWCSWGWTVLGEKTYAADGTTSLRRQPADDEGFTFFLRLRHPDLLNETKPYVLERQPALAPNPVLPAFSGRARLLYFDNLHPAPVESLEPGHHYWLTEGPVDTDQFASRAPSSFAFSNAIPGTTAIDITPLAPGGALQTYALNPKTGSVQIDLPENGYRFVQQPVNQSETLFLTTEIPPADTLGVLRIFKHPGSPGWEPHRQYKILFDQA